MGQIKNMKCSVCGNEWQQPVGSGFNTTYYHCDKCGKELVAGVGNQVDQCECGGTFGVDVVVCPLCHNIASEIDDKVVILWD